MNNAIRPICFVIMPFRVKPTGVKEGEGPSEVDFDRLWEKALRPAITALNYEAVRAESEALSEKIRETILLQILKRYRFEEFATLYKHQSATYEVMHEVGRRLSQPFHL